MNDFNQQEISKAAEQDLNKLLNKSKSLQSLYKRSKKILALVNKLKVLVTGSKELWIILGVVLVVGLFLIIGILFCFLPTSIFGESSDLTHDQRDQEIINVSSYKNLDIAVTNENLVSVINKYRLSWQMNIDTLIETEGINNVSSLRITEKEFNLICQIVAQESGDTYTGALAVTNCVVNRIAEGIWNNSWERQQKLESNQTNVSDPLSILTAKGQFAAYIDEDYKRYDGKIPENVKKAVIDGLEKGQRIHNYTQFRSYETEGSVNIEGNWYFDTFDGDTTSISYAITNSHNDRLEFKTLDNNEEENSQFKNNDPLSEKNWDLLYLICAYDASKNNLEGEVTNNEGESVSRYWDLIYGIGEYLLKAIFGTEIEVKSTVNEELTYSLFEEITLNVLEDGNIIPKNFYIKTGEAKTSVNLIIPEYIQVYGVPVIENQDSNLLNPDLFDLTYRDDLFIKTENTISLEPKEVEITERKRVFGLQKSVLLDVMDLNPTESYEVLSLVDNGSITNSDYIEYSRHSLIKILSLTTDLNTSGGSFGSALEGSLLGWVWPLDPNGRNVFLITSAMGTRESPGGYGSTNHGGNDIGASFGTAILAAQDGVVEIAGWYDGYGKAVRLDHGLQSDGNNYKTLYGHMSTINCSVGKSVKKGEIIGFVGSTGWSTGPHLHYEVIKNGLRINGLSMYDNSILDRLTFKD